MPIKIDPFLKQITFFLLLAFSVSKAFATSETISTNYGTLTYNVTSTSIRCDAGGGLTGVYTLSTFTGFEFTQGTTTTSLSGSTSSTFGSLGKFDCPANLNHSLTFSEPNYTIVFTTVGPSGTATVDELGTVGFINPKYVIVGITYAPPGPSSNVTYTGTTSVGSTTAINSSLSNDVGFAISETHSISGWTVDTGGVASVTVSSSTDYTQGTNSSTTTTISKATSLGYKTTGTGNAFSPIDSDYDTIWLWLNPEVILTYTAAPAGGQPFVQWNGFGFDPRDPSGQTGPDVYPVLVGWLNGHFGSNPSINAVLARSWASGETWPSGGGPGLTSADEATIVAADPLTSASYTLLDSLPATTSDGRFTKLPSPPNPIPYVQAGLDNGGGLTTMYGTVQTNTQSVASGASYQVKQEFGVQENFSGSIFGIGVSEVFKESDTITFSTSWLNTLTTTTTLANSLSVTGPPCPATAAPCNPEYAGPGEFLVYQDNLYGTFMFYPSN